MRSLRITVAILVLFGAAISAWAQIPHSMTESTNMRLGGNIYIAGTVFWPDGRQVNTRVNVRLKTPLGGEYSMSTDSNGQFIFGGLAEGRYTIVIDSEKDLEPAREDVEILPNIGGGHKPVYTVSLRLRERRTPPAKPAVTTVAKVSDKRQASLYYAKGVELAKKKEHGAAIDELKRAIALDPESVDAYNELGVQYQKLNELDKADEALKAALKIDPAALEPMLNRGIVLFRLNRSAEAEVILREVLAKQSSSPIAHFYLGRTLMRDKKYLEAEKELKAALDADVNLHEAHRMLAMLYIDTDDRPRAASELETYLSLVRAAPDADQLRKALSQVKAAIGKP